MKNKLITFKNNNFTALVIYLENINFKYFKKFLLKKIQKSPIFFKNIPIALNIEKLAFNFNWINLKKFFFSIGLFLIGIFGCKKESVKLDILKSGLPILFKKKKTLLNFNKKKNFFNKNSNKNHYSSLFIKNQKSYLVNELIRSGQRIYAPNTDLIITNNVSPGAELIADGNIHIYGNMKGRALAGAHGDETRKIFCTKLSAELISIAGEYCTVDQIPIKFLENSVEISLVNKKIFIKYNH
ncbi:septum site-determining protein MinC [Buchnera aphidicola]|uniref:Probable septum site-determining protein MinC n=1 Tax=Buchnera aphidicola subsp. Cinara cedri (strain Cc) TaxID=372461 RepID=MINC_BUCCC|nr:septum site-determining protein MinC [Buchnera aphidicola]Q057M2.1 RecName: Full=Probable septum site-determining protein MinC [Buchnera aphidicola BCc]ABJ90677.1 cell division inhibitor [Buchnera aphidicola BCc]